jgi:methyl-accepting chemotaxis protein
MSGIGLTNDAIQEMDNVTQQNAALMEQAAAAAVSMQEHATKLVEVVSAFRVDWRCGKFEFPHTPIQKACCYE